MRLAGAVLAVTLLLPVAACGDPIEHYCSAMQQDRKELADMVSSEAGSAALLDHLPMLRNLADQAPDDLTDEWQTFLNAVENLGRALRAAKVDPKDFKAGKPPAGTSAADVQSIQGAADQLASDDVVQAAGAIEQQARDVCKVNFGL